MTQQITPELSNAWQLKSTITKVAKRSIKTNQVLIEPFEINRNFASQYLAVGVTVNQSKDSWQYGGKVAQEFNFPNYSANYTKKGKAFNYSQDLLINRVTFIDFPPITSNDYKIHYFPPRYFTDVRVQIWEYKGTTKDILLERLGEFLVNLPPDQLVNLADTKVQLIGIEQKLCELTELIKDFNCSSNNNNKEITELEILRLFGYY